MIIPSILYTQLQASMEPLKGSTFLIYATTMNACNVSVLVDPVSSQLVSLSPFCLSWPLVDLLTFNREIIISSSRQRGCNSPFIDWHHFQQSSPVSPITYHHQMSVLVSRPNNSLVQELDPPEKIRNLSHSHDEIAWIEWCTAKSHRNYQWWTLYINLLKYGLYQWLRRSSIKLDGFELGKFFTWQDLCTISSFFWDRPFGRLLKQR
jgi:hypothetical protein